MLKIGIVGDLSQQDPALLAKALDAALASSDVVVQVGDVNPGYGVVKDRLATGKLYPIPGNHDNAGPGHWDESLPGVPKTWRKDFPEAVLIGLDNSAEQPVFSADSWAQLASYQKDQRPLFLFAHKSLSILVLPDGSESSHIMGEGAASPDADRLKDWMARTGRVTLCCGHFHGQSIVSTSYGTVLLEGRGGAAGPGNLGYTLVCVQPDGWTAHPVQIQ